MTRLSIISPALAVTLTLGTGLQAYGVEPTEVGVHQVGLSVPQTMTAADLDGACEVTLTAEVLAMLGLENGFPQTKMTRPATALACNDK